MNNSIFDDINLDKLNIKDLTIILEILNDINPAPKDEIEVI